MRRHVTIPDLSAAELVARAKREIDTTFLDAKLATWDFTQHRVEEGEPARAIEVRGKKYEVLTWAPGELTSSEQVCEHFNGLNADGNTAAFIAWVTETKPFGYHVSIPSDNTLLYRLSESGDLCAPDYFHGDDCHGDCRELDVLEVNYDWFNDTVFVAFREVK